ncbi:MAG: hypothetical protein KC496_09880, partial [Anaerolineae bacterium]|nr:hypothetical protein [Anaerolineae bacterium]
HDMSCPKMPEMRTINPYPDAYHPVWSPAGIFLPIHFLKGIIAPLRAGRLSGCSIVKLHKIGYFARDGV